MNVGVIVFCRTRGFLGALTCLDKQRLLAFAPDLDLEIIQHQLEVIDLTCRGAKEMGKIGEMSPAERYHWLVSPRSTIIQTSPAHCGLCFDPELTLRQLFQKLVAVSIPTPG